MTTPQAALDCLLAFGRNGRLDDRAFVGSHWIGESPHDSGYQVRVTLAIIWDAEGKAYQAHLSTGEIRYEAGQMSLRHEREMPVRGLGSWSATRFSQKRIEQLYNEVLASLRKNPQPLIDLLQEEGNRS